MTIATPPVTIDAATGRFFCMDGNIFLDANVIYEAGKFFIVILNGEWIGFYNLEHIISIIVNDE